MYGYRMSTRRATFRIEQIMSRRRERKLDTTVSAIQKRHGPQAVRLDMAKKHAVTVPQISTGYFTYALTTPTKAVFLAVLPVVPSPARLSRS